MADDVRAVGCQVLQLDVALDADGGDLFAELTGRGYSLFFLNAAIAFSQLSPMGAAEIYASALDDPEGCIGTVENLAAEAVAAYQIEVVA